MNNPESFFHKHPEINQIDVLIPDINGVLRGKRLPASQLPKLFAGELMIPRAMVLLDTLGNASDKIPFGYLDGDPDSSVKVIEQTLVAAPWQAKPTAQVIGEITDDAGSWFCNPAQVLRHSIQQFNRLELTPVIAIELEFHLLQSDTSMPTALQRVQGRPAFSGPQTYNLELLDDHSAFLEEVRDSCLIQGIAVGSALTEFGEGQFEINLDHTDQVIQACHDACMLRRLIRYIALKHKSTATFMAKPLVANAGNGMHVHISLLDNHGNNVLYRDGVKHSQLMQHAMAGLLDWMPQSMAIFAPNANSYQRLDPDHFAPVHADWGVDHRAVAIRLPKATSKNTRIEHRAAGADACPYLVIAAILSAIQHGIEQQLPLTAPTIGTSVNLESQPLHNRWASALEAFSQATGLQGALGTEFSQLYLQVKTDEEVAWHRQLNQFDHQLYLRTL